MQVILLKDVDHLGDEGEIVDVKNGYGRNYLIPKGLALMATAGSIRAREEELRQSARKVAQKKEDAQRVARELEDTEVVVAVRTGEENRIFGTVTAQQLAVELTQRGFNVDRRRIEFAEDIRVIGVYTAKVKVHPEVTANVKVRVISSSGDV